MHQLCQIWNVLKKLRGAELQSRKPHSSPSPFPCELTPKHSFLLPPHCFPIGTTISQFKIRLWRVESRQEEKLMKWLPIQHSEKCWCDQVDLSQKSYQEMVSCMFAPQILLWSESQTHRITWAGRDSQQLWCPTPNLNADISCTSNGRIWKKKLKINKKSAHTFWEHLLTCHEISIFFYHCWLLILLRQFKTLKKFY